MLFLDKMKELASCTRTQNGAVAYETSGERVLDFFAVAGGLRYRKTSEQIMLFDQAFLENPELTMKILFHIRDIREGVGERQVFRNLLRHAANTWPDSVRKNVHLIPEFGRWDDIFSLMDTPVWEDAILVIRGQLEEDQDALARRKAGEVDAHISLLAKWMPSINTSSEKTRRQAAKLAQELGMDQRSYRKMLSTLRANIALPERHLSRGQVNRITYRALPAGAMLKYRSAFERHDAERFESFMEDVGNGRAKAHAGTLFPYQIISPFINKSIFFPAIDRPKAAKVLEMLWQSLPDNVENENAISIIDTSGSMYMKPGNGGIRPAVIAQSLGLFHAEHCSGLFHNLFITFESKPHLVEVRGNTLEEKLRSINHAKWGMTTNLEAVFSLILRTAVESNAGKEEMPSVLYIISDMEFNRAIRDHDKSIYDNAKEMFAEHGYELPAVVFINVNSFKSTLPVRAHTKGAAMVSGAGVQNFGHKFDGNVTPMSHMLRILLSDRYKEVHA